MPLNSTDPAPGSSTKSSAITTSELGEPRPLPKTALLAVLHNAADDLGLIVRIHEHGAASSGVQVSEEDA
jgi:hypothetical protein